MTLWASSSPLPTFDEDTNEWVRPVEYDDSDGYGPVGSLLRFGPKPFFTRLWDPTAYDQAVLKYQAMEEESNRAQAQGNVDYYFENPNDWALQKMEEQKEGGYVRDYTQLDGNELSLTVAWGVGVSTLLLGGLYFMTVGNYCHLHPSDPFCVDGWVGW